MSNRLSSIDKRTTVEKEYHSKLTGPGKVSVDNFVVTGKNRGINR